MSPENLKYKRVLLKLSGESLAGEKKYGIDSSILNYFVSEIKKIHDKKIELGIVIGGGNIFRGLSDNAAKMDRVTADNMGMLATVINSLAIKDALEQTGISAVIMSAIHISELAEPFSKGRAIEYLKDNKVVIFAAGTGNPYFTTDTAGVLRAIEIEADVILKGTRVDGVYDSDPEKNQNSKLFSELKYINVIENGLKVMDLTAITLAMDNILPIIVFNFNKQNNLLNVISGKNIGTIVQG